MFLKIEAIFTYNAKLIIAIIGYGGWKPTGILLTRRWFT
jgi:hypothetical protein